jgi:tetratricopeptide (TPR) repeat protein
MQDFYEVLGIDRGATQPQVKAAFKRMAMRYHPDRNPGNREAEETFKIVNEAYHTLSDPVKKMRYDSRFMWVKEELADAYWQQEIRRRRYNQWRRSQDFYYRVDKDYFKIQGLAFLVFLIIAGFCFGVIHTAHYYVERQQMAKWRANSELLRQVNGLFGAGRFDDAFNMINILKEKEPLEFRFGYAKDSLVDALRRVADSEYHEKKFSMAINHYEILNTYEHPVRIETLEKMSMCQYYLGNYKESLQGLKHMHNQQPKDLTLIYQIGMINLHKLDNAEEALQYFTLGKIRFKDNLSQVYGKAFEVVMDPADAPDIYYHIFLARGATNMKLKNYHDAETDFNWAIFLRPLEGEPYHLRALAKISQQDYGNLCGDLKRASQLGVSDPNLPALKNRFCH